MTEVISLMDIDDDDDINRSDKPSHKGKNVAVTSSDGKATPWVEKYRPQSLADVAAHRDIVDTSESSRTPRVTLKIFPNFYSAVPFGSREKKFRSGLCLGLLCDLR